MIDSLPEDLRQILTAFEARMLTKFTGCTVIFGLAEENDTHIEAGVFNVPDSEMEAAWTSAYSAADELTLGTRFMITPIVRSIETTRLYYPKLR